MLFKNRKIHYHIAASKMVVWKEVILSEPCRILKDPRGTRASQGSGNLAEPNDYIRFACGGCNNA